MTKGKTGLRDQPQAPIPPTYDDKVRRMGALESFAPDIFKGDDECPQNVCDFVVALACAHNDLNDSDFAMTLLQRQKPAEPQSRSTAYGIYAGFGLHILRMRLGAAHELLELVRKNAHVLNDPFLVLVRKQLSRDEKESWDAIVEAAAGRPKDNELGKFLMMVRHKIAFHYDARRIAQGYEKRYLAGDEPALVARGVSPSATRFYFADGAAEEALFDGENPEFIADVVFGRNRIYFDIMVAVFHLITKFVMARGRGFRAYADDGKKPIKTPGRSS